MRIGISISEDLSFGVQREIAAHVEDAGLQSLWSNDGSGRDPMLVCQAWADETSSIDVGVGVASIWTRSPAQLAATSATLQELSGGRFILGLGVSHAQKTNDAHGAEFRSPVEAMRDVLTIIGQVDDGGATSFDGDVFTSQGFQLEMSPRPPRSRRFIAAMGPRMITLAGTHADGVLLNWTSAAATARAVETVRSAAATVGRSTSSVEVAGYVRIVLAEDRRTARGALAAEILRFVGRPAYWSHFERQGLGAPLEHARAMQRDGASIESVAEELDHVLEAFGWAGTPDDDPNPFMSQYEEAGLQHMVVRVAVVDAGPVDTIHAVIDTLRGAAATD